MKLEKPKESDGAGFWGVLKNRRSIRNFSEEPITKAELSQLLWASTGVTGKSMGHKLRAAPSAGALYPIETYVVVNNVEGLENGVYHYKIEGHELEEIQKGDLREELGAAALDQGMFSKAAVVFVWTIVFNRCASKYGQRAKRYVFMDSGHVAQNLLLAAEALGLGACPAAAFDDDRMNEIMGMDGGETVAYLAVVGKP
jgi:SagB-type dehydrogenase family enzyme